MKKKQWYETANYSTVQFQSMNKANQSLNVTSRLDSSTRQTQTLLAERKSKPNSYESAEPTRFTRTRNVTSPLDSSTRQI